MKSINLNFVHSESIGYGRLGVYLDRALRDKGVEVFDHMPAARRPDDHYDLDDAGPPGTRAGLASTACWVSVPTHAFGWWATQRPVLFTMWEATRLPESFRETLHNFDRVLVPSRQNVELFSQFHNDVRQVNLGVDPADWHYVERKAPGAFFDFLIGGSGNRKGTDLAYKAFLAAFPDPFGDGPIPRLILKNPKNETFDSHDGRVIVVGGKLPAEDEQALYASAHCYLQPSRGEGFGLQPLQAIAQGLPTILTDAHGHESFAHLGHGLSSTMVPAAYFIYGDAGDWWEPDFDELVEQMRYVYANYDAATAKAKWAAQVVAEDFTWANCADQFLDAVGDLETPFVPTEEWAEPNHLLYRIRTNKNVHLDVPTGRRLYFKGQDYQVTADSKRILAEAGYLDPECLIDDGSLTPEDHVRMGLKVDEPHYCASCGQREGSGKTKADDIFEQLEAEAQVSA